MIRVFLGLIIGGAAQAADGPRLGLNFIPYPAEQPADNGLTVAQINKDVNRLGAQAMRRFVGSDLVWRRVEPSDDQWHFDHADAAIKAPPATPVVTLFSWQYASAKAPWDKGPGSFRPVLTEAAKDYVKTVVERYADDVRYWEVGNEMHRWNESGSGNRNHAPTRRPPHQPPGGFSPEAQGRFVAEVATIIRAHDPDAEILMPGMGELNDSVLDGWLPGFVKGAGADGFDVVTYHSLGPWTGGDQRRKRLATVLKKLGIGDKPVWLTETGSSSTTASDPGHDAARTDAQQASDVFRLAVTAWASGDQAVFWHSYVSPSNHSRSRWQGYGLKDDQGQPKPAHSAYRLLAQHIAPHQSIRAVSGLKSGQYGYEILRKDGSMRWVYWGEGTVEAPTEVPAKVYTSVLPNAEGSYSWRGVADRFELSPVPVLLRN